MANWLLRIADSHIRKIMDVTEYRNLYAKKQDAAPGWDAIDRSLAKIYGKTEPWHWGTLIKRSLGGPDPIDGISAYENSSGDTSHFHFCSYGFSSLYYDEDAVGKDFSGFGFELTFRLANKGEGRDELIWVCNLIQNLGRYVFESEKWFEEYHWIPTNGPVKLGSGTDIVGLAFVRDPENPAIDSPHGSVEFLQIVGLTTKELEDVRSNRRTCEEVVTSLRQTNPLLITDLNRRDG